jgi:hypothetical protein
MMNDETNSHYHPKEGAKRFSFESTRSGKALSEATFDAPFDATFDALADDKSEQMLVTGPREQSATAAEPPAAAAAAEPPAAAAAAAEQPVSVEQVQATVN